MSRKKKIVFLSTISFLILLIVFSYSNPNLGKVSKNFHNTLTQPFYKLSSFFAMQANDAFEFLFGSEAMREEHRELKIENKKLKEDMGTMEMIIGRYDFLEKEHELLKSSSYNLKAAMVTSQDPSGYFYNFTLDKGANDGIEKGDIVVSGEKFTEATYIEGLVGVVDEVGPNWSKVSSTLSDGTSIAFVNSRNLEYGVLNAREELGLSGYVFEADSDIRKGDKLLTSGLGSVFPRNFYIGEVIDVRKNEELVAQIIVDSEVDFTSLYRVLIIDRDEVFDEQD